MSNLRKAVLGHNTKRSRLSTNTKHDFTPIKWSAYFDKEQDITTDKGTFHLYRRGTKGPTLLCLHGGGYSGLTWALFADKVSSLIECQIIALDFRGHGKTTTNNELDLSLDTLASDVTCVAKHLNNDPENVIILVGHSMGGAVAVEAAHNMDNVVGLCVIDVVEGTALDALSSMQSILRGRPSHFRSLPHAIQWCYKGGQTHNLEAARVSMPGQIVNIKSGKLAADECDNVEELQSIELSSTSHREVVASAFTLMEVAEENEEKDENDTCSVCGKPPLPKSQKTEASTNPSSSAQDEGPQYSWRINLSKTEQFWTGWFKGLSQKFLDLRIPKLLLLANIFGLDTTLTVGQMQGKFQMQVLTKSGHAIHEDQPQNVAELVSGYLVKQRIATPKSAFVQPNLPSC